jgi:hypothetical protein
MNIDTREAYLTEAAGFILDEIILPHAEGLPLPPFRISVGWPKGSRGGKVIAQCFVRKASTDGRNEIFVTPELDDPLKVLDALTHELCHAMDDCASGHRNYFARLARRIGLEGPLTATTAGPELKAKLEAIIKLLGDYPHHRMEIAKGRKPQGTRLLKIECSDCGFVARTTGKWIAEMTLPACCPVCETFAVNPV